ncbi:Nucleotide-binding, alpha-beta plait [Artemisia annua]|uniref:Nucleotide-binding, alpha-beta plait n=1 Tax=Artemisia annua TaxID=35608 RepID=A0A2U1L1N6_ARTAN|nr:Nucleotide-binding, alpha-beta plait [Artemisia annua]
MRHYKHVGSEADPDVIIKAKKLQVTLKRCNEARKLKGWNELLKETMLAISAGTDSALQVTHYLGGENYVSWGGREGYQTLLNTNMERELDHMENHGEQLSYGTPLHARPLLETPMQVLKLTNVLDPHSLSTLSEPELEEILEDILLKCARIHMIKQVKVIAVADTDCCCYHFKVIFLIEAKYTQVYTSAYMHRLKRRLLTQIVAATISKLYF